MDTSLVSAFANRETDQDFQGQLFTQIWEIFRTLNWWVRRGKKQINQEKMNLHVKLICLKRRKIGVPFRIRVHSNVFHISNIFNMALGKRQSIFKKAIFLLLWGILSFDGQRSIRVPPSFYILWAENKSLGTWHFREVKTLCKPWKMPRMALADDGKQRVRLEVKHETIKISETLFWITNRCYF